MKAFSEFLSLLESTKMNSHVTDTNSRKKGISSVHIERNKDGRPLSVKYNGNTYHYHKDGKSIKTGEIMHQMKHHENGLDKRLWINHSGSHIEED